MEMDKSRMGRDLCLLKLMESLIRDTRTPQLKELIRKLIM